MIIRTVSDIHLEMDNTYTLSKLPADNDTVLILAGDIALAKKQSHFNLPFFKELSRFKHVLYVVGNHEHYSGNLPTTIRKVKKYTEQYDNLDVLENEVVVIDGIQFVGCTLWTDFNHNDPVLMNEALDLMNDYYYIRTGPTGHEWKRKLRPIDVYAIHQRSIDFLNKTLNDSSIVITHHAPLHLSIQGFNKGQRVENLYYSDLSDLILDYKPILWVHGHTHRACTYEFNNTVVISNPKGYPGEYTGYNENMLIEI